MSAAPVNGQPTQSRIGAEATPDDRSFDAQQDHEEEEAEAETALNGGASSSASTSTTPAPAYDYASHTNAPNWFATATPAELLGFAPVEQQLSCNAAEPAGRSYANDKAPHHTGNSAVFNEARRPLLPGENLFEAVDPVANWRRFHNILGGFVPNPGTESRLAPSWDRENGEVHERMQVQGREAGGEGAYETQRRPRGGGRGRRRGGRGRGRGRGGSGM